MKPCPKEKRPRIQFFKATCGDFYMAKGAQLWEKGTPPNKPPEEEFVENTPWARIYLGYSMARALDHQERCEIAELLGCSKESVNVRD